MLKDSRMAKVAPLSDLLNEKLQSFGVVHEDLSVDKISGTLPWSAFMQTVY